MLRQFSTLRVVVFCSVDWVGTLALLFLVAWLHAGPSEAWRLPSPEACLLVAGIWPCAFFALSVYDGRYNGTLQAELFRVLLATAASTASVTCMQQPLGSAISVAPM